MSNETLVRLPPKALRPNPRNPRTHSKKQVRQIAQSIQAFGFLAPPLIDEDRMILAGHARVEAAKLVKLPDIPCRRVGGLSPEKKLAYLLADNKLAANAGWHEHLLAEDVKELSSLDLDFDITATGFSIPEIDGLIEGLAKESHCMG